MSCHKDVVLHVPSDTALVDFLKTYRCEHCGKRIDGKEEEEASVS